MVGGLGIFRERFARFSDNFVIIGGTACNEILSGTDRAIVDVEIVDTIREFAEGLLESLPNQSLQDALRSSEATIRMFLEAMPTYYTAQ